MNLPRSAAQDQIESLRMVLFAALHLLHEKNVLSVHEVAAKCSSQEAFLVLGHDYQKLEMLQPYLHALTLGR